MEISQNSSFNEIENNAPKQKKIKPAKIKWIYQETKVIVIESKAKH